MGTTLTGTTPQDTYDSLIKVTDNGPLTGSLKKLTDGLGNDSSLSLSTTAASIAGTLAVTGNATFDTNTLFVDAANNKVSIGNTIPSSFLSNGNQLVVGSGAADQGMTIYSVTAGTGNLFFADGTAGDAAYRGFLRYNHADDSMQIYTNGANERMRITSAGDVGIGTSAPDVFGRFYTRSVGIDSSGISKMQINGTTYSGIDLGSGGTRRAEINASATGLDISTLGSIPILLYTNGVNRISVNDNGLTFNGDTAAANALDDYEEGTWTMGVSFDGASVGVTTSSNTGTYTKIGRQVTVNGFLALTSKGSSTGRAKITGLPFTIPNNVANYGAASLWFNAITFANQLLANGVINETTIELEEITEAGVRTGITEADFANNTSMIVNFTYFV
jgi:hypothetical protein